MRRILGVIVAGAMLVGGLVMSETVLAAPESVCSDPDISEELKEAAGCKTEKDISNVAVTLINFVVTLVGIISVAAMVYGGVIFTTSQGDANKVKKAQYIVLYSAVGLIVSVLAFAIVMFVSNNVL